MKVFKIDKAEWENGINRLADTYELFGPVREQDFHLFKPLAKGRLPDIPAQNTRMSVKDVLYPQTQPLFDYSLDENDADHHQLKDVPWDETPKAVIGLRPCDADAVALVGRNFVAKDIQDPYWVRTLEATTLVGYACDTPCPVCFCTSAGSGPYNDAALDVLLADSDGAILANAVTEKGEKLLAAAGWDAALDDSLAETLAAQKEAAEAKVTAQVTTDKLAGHDTMALYNASFWEDVSFSCINCGTCTFLCPTCWCFDIQDETHGTKGQRMRNWDSCMFPLFTLHGSGHNPRGQKVQRVRQRFMHKLKYYVDKYENGIQCVGCGRCVMYCPVNIDIRRVAELMNQLDLDAEACAI